MLIIGTPYKIKWESALKKACAAASGLIALVLLGDAYMVFFRNEKLSYRENLMDKAPVKDSGSQFRNLYEMIGTGPLSLHVSQFSSFSPNLARELVVRACNTRPDAKGEEIGLLLGFRHGAEEQVVMNGQPVYVDYRESSGEPLKFAGLKTNLWIKPLLLDKGSVLIEVGKDVAIAENEKHEEKTQFILTSDDRAKDIQQEIYVKMLAEAKCWGIDMLMRDYGGEEYRDCANRCKLEFPDGRLCYVGPGDFLTWEEGQWKASPLKEVSHTAPLAWVKPLQGKELEVQVWDESGFYSSVIKIDQQTVPKMTQRSDLPSSIRLRTASQITCLVGKRRMVLRKGDWLMRTVAGWRILKRLDEIEDCLQHRIKGELLIFDGIEKSAGQTLMKGHLFDEMRTQVLPIEIAMVAEKKSARRRKLQQTPVYRRKAGPRHPGKIGDSSVAVGESIEGTNE